MSILVVDDDPYFVRLVDRLFPGVLPAYGPAEGLDLVTRPGIELALLDVNLGDGSCAFSTLRTYRAAAPHVPVVMVTAHFAGAAARALVDAGARYCLEKGDNVALKELATDVLEESRTSDGAPVVSFREAKVQRLARGVLQSLTLSPERPVVARRLGPRRE